jgi:hypothetical protein
MSQPHQHTNDETPPSTPRWVKVFGGIFIVLVLLVFVLHLTGNSLGELHGSTPPSQFGMYRL